MFRDDRNYGGSDLQECTTRILVRDGHNLTEDGVPASQVGGCDPCGNEHCCDYTGLVCGCDALNCVDRIRNPEGRFW